MGNGYDPRDGELMVPFDLRKDVIDRLDRHGRGMAEMGKRIDEHVAGHDAALDAALSRHDERRREVRRSVILKALKIAGGVGAAAIPVALGLLSRS